MPGKQVGSLLSFFRSLRCVFTFAVFYRRNKVVLRRAVVNANFFSFFSLICSSFGTLNFWVRPPSSPEFPIPSVCVCVWGVGEAGGV